MNFWIGWSGDRQKKKKNILWNVHRTMRNLFSLENLPAKAGHDHGILLPRVSEVPHHPVDDTSKSHVFFPIDITL